MVAQATGSRSWDSVAPQLLVWYLEPRDEAIFLASKDADFERLPSSVPAAKAGGTHA